MHKIYEPREDSEQLAVQVEKYSKGKVLDMGTGSGIQALAALKNLDTKKVLAVDINPNVIEHIKRIKVEKNLDNLDILESNLFENIDKKDKFDTIIFNPPYLPNEENIKDGTSDDDVALYGGKEGWELSVNFLEDAPNFLKRDGKIIFLFSSLTKKDVIDITIKKVGMSFEELSVQNMFFEKLYVYRIYF